MIVNSIISLIKGPYINNNTDRTLDVVFSRFRGFPFARTPRPKEQDKTEKEHARNSFGLLSQRLL